MCVLNVDGSVPSDASMQNLLHDGQLLVEQVRTSQRTPLVSALLYGPPGSGKTAMAATIAQASEFPFIKLVSPENMVGFSESQKIAAISKAFADSYKSPLSIVVVDNIERLLGKSSISFQTFLFNPNAEWVPIGPRFSNAILQTLLVLIAKRPPKGKRLFVMVTTSLRPALTDLQMSDLFDTELYVPPISTLPAMQFAIKELELFTQPSDLQRAMTRLEQSGFGQGDEFERAKRSVGIKKLLSIVEMARQEPDNIPEQLVSSIMGSTI
jgi:vesicle-fusing ATPase